MSIYKINRNRIDWQWQTHYIDDDDGDVRKWKISTRVTSTRFFRLLLLLFRDAKHISQHESMNWITSITYQLSLSVSPSLSICLHIVELSLSFTHSSRSVVHFIDPVVHFNVEPIYIHSISLCKCCRLTRQTLLFACHSQITFEMSRQVD